MRGSTNPVFRRVRDNTYLNDQPVTYSNVAIKSVFLVALVFLSAFITYSYGDQFLTAGFLFGALIVGFISVIIGSRSVRLSPIFAIIYALAEGVVLALVSSLYAAYYEGIVPTALATTFIVFLIMLLLYSTRVIRVTQRFASIMVVMLISVILMSLLSFVFPFSGSFYYVIVIISAGLSAFFLLMHFAQIESLVEAGADSKYGWILALGLLVTLVWVYIEMLRLLAIVARRN